MLSERVKNYTALNEGNDTPTYMRTATNGKRQVWLRPLLNPGEWFIYWEDYENGTMGCTSMDKDLCFGSLMTAMQTADLFINGKSNEPTDYKR